MDGAMWGTIVGGILGFLGAILPKVFELLDGWVKHQQEHRAQAQQIDAASKGVTLSPSSSGKKVQVEEEGVVPAPGIPPDLANTSALEAPESDAETLPATEAAACTFWVKFFNTLRYSVRPVVTYGFFVLFLLVKLQGLHHGFDSGVPVVTLLPAIWDEGTESLFAAVLAFWFGSRAFEKTRALSGSTK